MPNTITCLRDYMHAVGLDEVPPCFYCGLSAETIDHVRSRVTRGPPRAHNIKPACHRCNMRKGKSSVAAFRSRLETIDQLYRKRRARRRIEFHGEGTRGADLRALRQLLERVTLTRTGKLRVVRGGEPLTKPHTAKAAKRQRKRDVERPRWLGRFTFAGSRALRDLSACTGYSFPVIERFVLGSQITPDAKHKLVAALRELHLSRSTLAALKPPR